MNLYRTFFENGTPNLTRAGIRGLFVSLIVLSSTAAKADLVVTYCSPSSDVGYHWNTRYAASSRGYTQNGTLLYGSTSVYSGMIPNTYYEMGILELQIADLRGVNLVESKLWVYSEGFTASYLPAAAGLRWLDVGTLAVTGAPEADQLGSLLNGTSIEYEIWNSTQGQTAGWYSFDVTDCIRLDLDAGRDFSSFVLNASRNTFGSIRAAEYGNGFGPRLESLTSVPEPAAAWLLGLIAMASVCLRYRPPIPIKILSATES